MPWGALGWTTAQHSAFVNDLGDERSLVAVTDNENQAKGKKDPRAPSCLRYDCFVRFGRFGMGTPDLPDRRTYRRVRPVPVDDQTSYAVDRPEGPCLCRHPALRHSWLTRLSPKAPQEPSLLFVGDAAGRGTSAHPHSTRADPAVRCA